MKNYILVLFLACVSTIKAAELDFINKSDKPIVVNWREHALSDHQKDVELPELMRKYVKNGKPIPEALNPFRKKETKFIAPGGKAHFSTGAYNIRLMTIDEYLPGGGETKTVAVIQPNINWSDLRGYIKYYAPDHVEINNKSSLVLQDLEGIFTGIATGIAMLPAGLPVAAIAEVTKERDFVNKERNKYNTQAGAITSEYQDIPTTTAHGR